MKTLSLPFSTTHLLKSGHGNAEFKTKIWSFPCSWALSQMLRWVPRDHSRSQAPNTQGLGKPEPHWWISMPQRGKPYHLDLQRKRNKNAYLIQSQRDTTSTDPLWATPVSDIQPKAHPPLRPLESHIGWLIWTAIHLDPCPYYTLSSVRSIPRHLAPRTREWGLLSNVRTQSLPHRRKGCHLGLQKALWEGETSGNTWPKQRENHFQWIPDP